MDSRMLDRALPIVYVIAIVVVAMTTDGKAVGIVAVVGALLLGMYYSAIRPSLKRRDAETPPRQP